MNTDRILLCTVLMLGFCVTAPMIDVASKLAATSLPVGQITAARFVVQGALMLPVMIWFGLRLVPDRASLWPLIWRAVFLITSTYCFVAAIAVMPIADALAIVFVEPFLLLIAGHFLFGDTVGPRRIGASLVGFVGCLMVIQPSLQVFGLVALFPLGTAVTFAAYMLVTRSLSRSMHPVAMQFHSSTVASLMCVPIVVLADRFHWPTLDPVMPQGLAWVWLFGVGFAAAVSHMMMTYALRFAPSATLAPLHYLEIVSAVILGYTIFSDFPNAMALAGTGVIIASGLYVVYRERVTAREGSVTLPPLGSEGMS